MAYRLGYTANVVKQHLSTNIKFMDPVMVHPKRQDVSVGLQCVPESQTEGLSVSEAMGLPVRVRASRQRTKACCFHVGI